MKNHLTSLGEKSWFKCTVALHKAADLKFCELHLDCFFLLFFLKRSGCCSWVGIRANMSLPQVVLLPAGTRATCANAAKNRLDRKKQVSASLETELESQP